MHQNNQDTPPAATLADLQPGQTGVVQALHSHDLERRRMMDLGLVPGTRVRVEMNSPLGDPVAYRVRGAVVALRREQARLISISTDNTDAAGADTASAEPTQEE